MSLFHNTDRIWFEWISCRRHGGEMEFEMIYTVTFNPSLDYVVQVEHFQSDAVNRTSEEHVYPGGKGNNVAVIASNLGMKSRALGFKAGFTGAAMEQMLQEFGCDTDFIALEEGVTRINVKVKSEDEFEINGQGPRIPEEKIRQLYERLDALGSGDVLVLSGSIPNTLPDDMYERIMERLAGTDVRISVDATKDLLMNVLKYHPFLIKPNNHELGELFSAEITKRQEAVPYARKLQDMGARNVLVSMAGEGAVLVAEDGTVHGAPVPEGKLVNAVGSGDSMVAGFLAGWMEEKDYGHAFRMGVAAGSASAFSEYLATGDEIRNLYKQIQGRQG